MSTNAALSNQVRNRREAIGWSQAELASRAGLSRSEVSAIETARLVPSTVAALRLAQALGCSVEELFVLGGCEGEAVRWATREGASRYWNAEVGGVFLRFGSEALATGVMETDESTARGNLARETLVIATCDPAASLMVRRLERLKIRCLALTRPSRCALQLLKAGVVHAAGIHLGGSSDENARIVRKELGPGYRLVRVAVWEEGLAFSAARKADTMGSAALCRMRWIGRQPGSGARKLSDKLLGSPEKLPPGYETYAPDHRAVAQSIRMGLATVGVCVRLAAEEQGLGFKSVAHQSFDLCMRERDVSDARVASLVAVLQSREYRASLGSLPGISSTHCGEGVAIR